jgi:hypothetical protein
MPVGLDAVEVDLVDLAQLEQLALEPGQALGVDLAVAQAAGLDASADGADGAGRADGLVPGQAVQGVLDAHQLQARGGVGLGIARRGDLAVAEVALGEADAAHLQAFAQQRLEALADDELGAAAADVGDQALAGGVGEGVGNAQVDQARFFTAGDDLDRVAENGFGARMNSLRLRASRRALVPTMRTAPAGMPLISWAKRLRQSRPRWLLR